MCCIDIPLVGLEFHGQGSDFIVDLLVVSDLMGQAPVVEVAHHVL